MDYVELPHNKKLALLNDHDGGWDNLDQTKWCLHCSQEFTGLSTRVQKDEQGKLWLECGTPGCGGSPIDWAPYPWWNPEHPAAQAYFEKHPEEREKFEDVEDDESEEDI